MKGHFSKERMAMLEHWITERERIRAECHDVKHPPSKPWTPDPVLATYSFCNVVRMDDRVSRWLFKHWYVRAVPDEVKLLQACAARLINWPPTLAAITPIAHMWNDEGKDARIMQRELTQLWRPGKRNVFGNAYLVVNSDFKDGGKVAGVPRLIQRVLPAAINVAGFRTMEMQHAVLRQVSGYGSFLAGQVIADLRHLRGAAWARDRMQWAPVGPGSARGMRRLMGQDADAKTSMRQAAFGPLLRELMDVVSIPSTCASRFEAMDLQNCLCEFDKYCRAMLDGHRPHRLYRGSGYAAPQQN